MKRNIHLEFIVFVNLLLTFWLHGSAHAQGETFLDLPVSGSAVKEEVMGQQQANDLPLISTPDAGVEYVDYAFANSESVEESETGNEDGDQKITITLDGVSLEDTLRLFIQAARVPINFTPTIVSGKFVTVNLQDVDWQPALRTILKEQDLDLVETVPNTGIYSIQKWQPTTMVKTFFLDYTTSSEMFLPVSAMLSPESDAYTALEFNSRNALVVRSTEANIAEIEKLIDELDRPGKQILVEAKIMELNDQAAKQIGIRWDSLEAFGIQAGLGPFSREETTTRNNTARDDYESGRENESSRSESRMFDINGAPLEDFEYQVFDPDDDPETDNSIFYREISPTTSRMNNSRDFENIGKQIAGEFANQITEAQSAILSIDSFQLVLSALEKTDGVSIVSNPKIILTSGSTGGEFKVVESEPDIQITETAGNDNNPRTLTANKVGVIETGIKLNVKATVKTDNYIEAEIIPQLSRLVSRKEVGANSWPVVFTKEISTRFTLRSGQTVAIGGLTEVRDDKKTTKIPFLGSIPVIGRLFSHSADIKRQVETIIFVTLSLADPDELGGEVGIPQDARLVHKKLYQQEKDRIDYLKAIELLNDKAEDVEEKAGESRRTKHGSFRR